MVTKTHYGLSRASEPSKNTVGVTYEPSIIGGSLFGGWLNRQTMLNPYEARGKPTTKPSKTNLQ